MEAEVHFLEISIGFDGFGSFGSAGGVIGSPCDCNRSPGTFSWVDAVLSGFSGDSGDESGESE
jgi:hypothetical protein